MARRRRENRQGIQDLSVVLAQMNDGRQAAISVGTEYPIGSEASLRATDVLRALDNLAEALTGKCQAHWPQSVSKWPPREFDVSHLRDAGD